MKKIRNFIITILAMAMLINSFAFGAYASESWETSSDYERDDSAEMDVPIDYDFFEALGLYHTTAVHPEISSRVSGTWQHLSNGKWRYIHDDGGFTIDNWEYINGYWYYFDSNGYMYVGWLENNGHIYYLEEATSGQGRMAIGWKAITVGNSNTSKWFYFNEHGIMVTGWKYLAYNGVSNWYFFASNGEMQTGWLQRNNNWYYLKANGVMATGWQQIGNNVGTYWYFFKSTGEMVTGWYNVQGYTYYFNSSGQLQDTTRRAIVISNAYPPAEVEINGWENCLSDMTFYEGEVFEQIETASTLTYTGFCNLLNSVMSEADESDVTYLCLTCHGASDGDLEICTDTLVSGQELRNILDQYSGKIVLLLNTCYAGMIIGRGDMNSRNDFLSSFLGGTRSGELANEKYLVLCSSAGDELSEGYYYNNSVIGWANRYWTLGGGWDIHNNISVQMYADADNNSIVTLNELFTYSSAAINNHHVVVYPLNSSFTIFSKLN